MKYTFLLKQVLQKSLYLLFFLFFSLVHSQEYSAGIKGGVSYSLNDNGSEIFRNGERFSAESDFGYLGGAFLELKFGNWLVRPEVIYNNAKGEFMFPNFTSEYSIDKLSVPLLLGYNIYGPVDVYAGPAYQAVLNKSLENAVTEIAQEHNNFAAQVGFKLNFNRWEIDLRYDFTFPSNDFQNIRMNNTFGSVFLDDGRLNQLILSLNYKIFGSNLSTFRRSGSCYF